MLLDLCQFNVYLLSVMLNKQDQKPVSSRNIFFLLIILVPLALFAWFFISQSLTENKLKGAISELELATGVETQSVDCHNEEFKTVCTANYGLLDYNKAKDMLIKGAIVFVMGIRAANKVRVMYERGMIVLGLVFMAAMSSIPKMPYHKRQLVI